MQSGEKLEKESVMICSIKSSDGVGKKLHTEKGGDMTEEAS